MGPIVYTQRELLRELQELRAMVTRLADRDESGRAQVADHETRLRLLERARWPLPSLAILISVASVVVALLANK